MKAQPSPETFGVHCGEGKAKTQLSSSLSWKNCPFLCTGQQHLTTSATRLSFSHRLYIKRFQLKTWRWPLTLTTSLMFPPDTATMTLRSDSVLYSSSLKSAIIAELTAWENVVCKNILSWPQMPNNLGGKCRYGHWRWLPISHAIVLLLRSFFPCRFYYFGDLYLRSCFCSFRVSIPPVMGVGFFLYCGDVENVLSLCGRTEL